MKKTKKNNKGFSLVELIVVILIMAILGVALAPQVMRWVNNSRMATDASNYDAAFDAAQIAAATTPPADTLTFKMTSSGGLKFYNGANPVTAGTTDNNTKFVQKFQDILPEYANINISANNAPTEYTFTVDSTGKVTKGVKPSSDIS